MLTLDDILAWPLDERVKGVPSLAAPVRLGEVGAQGWNLLHGDLPFPAAVLKDSALRHNGDWMRAFLARTGVALAPHGKTTMSPQLFQRQLESGAWGITVATAHQLSVCRRYGVPRVLMANQLVDPASIRLVLDALAADPGFAFLCLVDSLDGVARLAAAVAARSLGRPLELLVEVGYDGGRTGCRTLDGALAVARAVAAAPGLALRGVEAFEGLIVSADAGADAAKVQDLLARVVETVRRCDAEGLLAAGPAIVSAGGSAYYDLAAERLAGLGLSRPVEAVLRSGCYLTHDSGFYRRLFERIRGRAATDLGEGLRPALEVWASVQSRPEPGLAILTMGKRDASFDIEMPVPAAWAPAGGRPQPIPAGCSIAGMNDQHAYLRLAPGFEPAVGDLVACGISHPCTTFDRWQVLMVVDDDYGVVDAIRTFF